MTRAIEVAEITAMMSTEGGRNVISRILDSTGVFTDTFDIDTHKHAYNAGKRRVGLSLIEQLQEAAPDKYLQLLDEKMTIEPAAIVTAQTEEQSTEELEVQTTEQPPAEDAESTDGEESTADTSSDDTDADGTNDSSLEAYADFTMPEGTNLDVALLEQATPLFKELGLNQEQAQKLVDFQAQQVQAGQQGQMDAFNQLKTDWADQAKKDPEIGGDDFNKNVGIAKQALDKFGNDGLTKLLNDFGLGNHPEVIRLMTKVGKLTMEDVPDSGKNIGNGPRDHASVLYPE